MVSARTWFSDSAHQCMDITVCVLVRALCGVGWLSLTQVRDVRGSLSPTLHHSPPLHPPCLLFPVESHNCFLSFINVCPRANNSSPQPFIAVTWLSEPSRSNLLPRRSPVTSSPLTIVLEGTRGKVCWSKKRRKRMKQIKRQTGGRRKENNKMSGEPPCEQM